MEETMPLQTVAPFNDGLTSQELKQWIQSNASSISFDSTELLHSIARSVIAKNDSDLLDFLISLIPSITEVLIKSDDHNRSYLHFAAIGQHYKSIYWLIRRFQLSMCQHDVHSFSPIDLLLNHHCVRLENLFSLVSHSPYNLNDLLEDIDPLWKLTSSILSNHTHAYLQYNILQWCSVELRKQISDNLESPSSKSGEFQTALIRDILRTGSVEYLNTAIQLRLVSPSSIDRIKLIGSNSNLEALSNSIDLVEVNDCVNMSWMNLLLEEKYEMIKHLLVYSHCDMIPSCLQVYMSCEYCLRGKIVLDLHQHQIEAVKQFAQELLLQVVCLLHDSGNNAEKNLMETYIDGGFQWANVDDTISKCGPKFVHPTKPREALVTLDDMIAESNITELFSKQCMETITNNKWKGGKHKTNTEVPHLTMINPRYKFILHTVAFIIFFVLVAIEALTMPVEARTWLDWVVLICSVAYLVQELFEIYINGSEVYKGNIWNGFDVLSSLFLNVGIVWRVVDYRSNPYDKRMIICFSLMLLGMKGLSLLRVHKKWGSMINMMKTLFWEDLIPFLISFYILLVLCSGIFFHSLLNPNSYSYFNNNTAVSQDWNSLFQIYTRPLLLSFGELQLDDHTNCIDNNDGACFHRRGNLMYINGFIQIYLIIVNLLLMNLLIAKFSLTVSMKHEISYQIWQKYRYDNYKEYKDLNILPPPLNIIEIPCILVVQWLTKIRRALPGRNGQSINQDNKVFSNSMLLTTNNPTEYQHFLIYQALNLRKYRLKLYNLLKSSL